MAPWVALAWLAFSPLAWAAPALDIDVLVGHAGVFRLGAFSPVVVTVHNAGSAVSGHLELVVDDGEASTATLTRVRAVELPRETRKRWRFTVPLRSITEPLVVQIRAGDEVIARKEIGLRNSFTDGRLILGLSRDAHLDYLNEPSPGDGGPRTRVVYPLPEQLPDSWRGYDSVVAVVVQGVSLERLSAAQYRALRDWIASGGVLAVSGGPAYAEARTPRLASMLPAMPVGLVDAPDPSVLKRAFGDSLHVPAPFRINRVSRVTGRALLRAGTQPLVIEGQLGLGRVLYLAFDVARYPFDTWEGLPALWLRILDLPDTRNVTPIEEDADEDSPVLMALAGAGGGFPDHGGIIAFLALYLGILVTVHQVWWDRATRSWTAWLGILGVPVVFSTAGWYAFGPVLFPAAPAAVTATVLTPLTGTDRAIADVDLGLYAPYAGPLRFTHAGARPAFIAPDPVDAATPVPAWRSGEDGETFIGPAHAEAYRIHRYRGSTVVHFGLSVTLERSGDGLVATVSNRAVEPLNGVWVALGATIHRIGPLAPDETVKRALSGATALPAEVTLQNLSSTFEAAGLRPGLARAGAAMVTRRAAEDVRNGVLPGVRATAVALTHGPIRATRSSADWRHVDVAVAMVNATIPPLAEGPGGDLAEDPH